MTQYARWPSISGGGGGGGTVTSVALDTNDTNVLTILGSPVTVAGTLTIAFNLQSGNVVLASPSDGSSGLPTFRSLVSADIPALSYVSSVGATAPIQSSGGLTPTISITQSSTSTNGYLSSTDWNTFNNKQSAGSYITALTTDVVAAGPGSAAATIQTNVVSNSKLAQMPANTMKGNNTGSTANAADLTVSQVRTLVGIGSGSSFIISGTTYTTPSNITTSTQFKFTLVGGGGGGGGINTANAKGSGGGGAGTCIVYLTGLTSNTGYTIAIGAAGAGGISTTTAATAGGNTTLTVGATTYSANGGGAGANTTQTNGGSGGGASNGTINIAGGVGGANSTAATSTVSGYGGDSLWGVGGSPINPAGTGFTGSGYGAGGSGGSGAASNGGAGSQGMILVEWCN